MALRKESHEVCIVGCGIAGSTLAYNLAPEIDTCVVEKNPLSELGLDPCGNAVHRSWFGNEGVNPGPTRFDAVASTTDRIRLNLPDETLVADLSEDREGLILRKDDFVRGMIGTARDQGVDFIQGKANPDFENGSIRRVKVDGVSIEADVYVDASGVSAVLRNGFARTPEDILFEGYREVIDAEPDFDCWRVYQYEPDSAYWAFPQGDSVNLGGVAFRDCIDLESGVQELKERIGLSGAGLESAGFAPIVSLNPIELVYDNVVAIGDAGGTVNPVTGGGIGPSMKVANMLSEIIKRGEGLEELQERYLSEVASGYEKNYWLSRVFLKLQRFFWKRVAKWAFKKFYGGVPVEG